LRISRRDYVISVINSLSLSPDAVDIVAVAVLFGVDTVEVIDIAPVVSAANGASSDTGHVRKGVVDASN